MTDFSSAQNRFLILSWRDVKRKTRWSNRSTAVVALWPTSLVHARQISDTAAAIISLTQHHGNHTKIASAVYEY